MEVCKFLNFKFAHHHVHSEYSPWDAPLSLKKLIGRSKELGYRTVTVTDHGTVGSWVKLAYLCKEAGIKPIFGIEAYFTQDRKVRNSRSDNHHLVLLAKNRDGIRNIFRLSQLAYSDGFYYDPRIDWDLLEKYHEGVVCTSGCVSGIVPETLGMSEKDPRLENKDGSFATPLQRAKEHVQRFKGIFGNDFYIEVQYHALDVEKPYKDALKLATEMGIKTVGTNDVHYLNKGDASIQEAMMALNTGRCMKDPDRMQHGTNQFYLKAPEEMIEQFGGKDSPLVQGALEIADACTAELEMGRTQLPSVELPQGFTDDMDYLEHLAREGLKKIGKEGDPIYEARFKDEIGVVRRLKEKGKRFDRYFLVVWDYVNWAWSNGIRVGVGRGSGAGSLLLYCLRITGLDPIPHNLLFERFLTDDRNDMPDIDIDFDYENGERVYEYVCKKYGADKCARIGTVNTLHVASALRSAFRVFDPGNTFEADQAAKKIAEKERAAAKRKGFQKKEKAASRDETVAMANEITKLLPKAQSGAASDKCTLNKETHDKKPDEIAYVYDDPEFVDRKRKFPEIFAFAEAIEGLINSRGIHAAGVLITEDELVKVCPQQFSGKAKNLATAFDMNDVEKVGGVKFDFLRTKVLSVISRAVKSIEERWSVKVDIDNLPVDDKGALAVFTRGDTLGIFQFESDGMVKLLRGMKADTFEDIVAANALYRPGPMQFIDSYCKRKKGSERVAYAAPALEPILKTTYGILVYQEQVMKAVRVLAGFTANESEKVRKAMGKKKRDILDAMKDKFIKGCEKLGTCSKEVSSELWTQLEKFSQYCFNRSHAAGYSYTAYQCAWLKAKYPAEFIAAQLTVEGGDACYETVADYERGVRNMGIELLSLCINNSKGDYVVVDGPNQKPQIRRGFKGVMGVGQAHEDIVKCQPYKSIFDYCMRAGSGANSGVFMAIMNADSKGKTPFDCFLPALSKRLRKEAGRQDLIDEYEDQVKRAKVEAKTQKAHEGMVAAFAADEEEEEKGEFSL